MRQPFVAGNWKMNLDLAAAKALVTGLRERIGDKTPLDVAVCPPSIYILPVVEAAKGSPIAVGAQNCWHEASGAFTGEISVGMIKDAGATYVILGHSERRHTIGPKSNCGQIKGETDEMIAAKAKAVMAAGLVPIICVGEKLEERDAGQTEDVLTRQIAGSLAGLDISSPDRVVIAYEPVWAIGTGRNATPQQAQDAHKHIRARLTEQIGASQAEGIRIQYGGSVKPSNVEELMRCPDVDGALVGGASLKVDDFVGILEGSIRAKGLS